MQQQELNTGFRLEQIWLYTHSTFLQEDPTYFYPQVSLFISTEYSLTQLFIFLPKLTPAKWTNISILEIGIVYGR